MIKLKKNNYTKCSKEKNYNQNNEDQIKKNQMMK
jgi:hypothetical protein